MAFLIVSSSRAGEFAAFARDLDPALDRLGAAGFEHRVIAFDGDRHAFVTDPAGNLWELVGP